MFERVLVPLDGSRFAESALPLATAVARRPGASLQLVSVYDPVPPPVTGAEDAAGMTVPAGADALGAVPVTTAEVRESVREERTTYLRETARRLREGGGPDAQVLLLEGRPDRAIQAQVRESGADLVVMATHGRGPVERAWLGSVADRLVRELAVPVLLVRPVKGERPDLSAEPLIERVLVTLDGSRLAEAALGPAADLAAALGASLRLVRVIGGRLEVGSPYMPHAAQAHREYIAAERKAATDYLDRIRRGLEGNGSAVVGADVLEGPPARSILDAAEREDGGQDVVAMATHGRGGLRRLVLGSVSDKVVRAAVGPVLLVRPEGAD